MYPTASGEECFDSSYIDYLDESRMRIKILDKKEFPKYFPTKNSFEREIIEWLSFKE